MTALPYKSYWARKRLKAAGCPPFPVVRCSGQDIDGGVRAVIGQAIAGKERLLDIGAGNLHVRKVFRDLGFKGNYETLDIGTEHEHTYSSIDQVQGRFGAILVLDVIEHLALDDGLKLLESALSLVEEGGALVVQTPNGRCVRSPFTSDMTHVQSYNLPDLWAYLTVLGSNCSGYRVAFGAQTPAFLDRATSLVARAVITRLLGLDYADNILLVATKTSHPAQL
jgi:2-polyprenyl-3-methyl-5-hydroxy-6-metoxy-1,4-benzoquinol methylase